VRRPSRSICKSGGSTFIDDVLYLTARNTVLFLRS